MELNEQQKQVYAALQKWATRLNHWEYSKQIKRNKGKRLKQFTPNGSSLILIDGCYDLCNGTKTADEVMALIHMAGVSGELRECMSAGF